MKKSVRLLTALMAVLMLLSTLASCASSDDIEETTPETEVTTVADTESPWETDENGFVKDTIPEVNYGGKVVNTLAWDDLQQYNLPADAGNNDIIRQTVYMRRLALEERLNIEFNPIHIKGAWGDRDSFLTTARKAGENEYDLICSYSLLPTVLAQEGLLYNLKNLTYPVLEMPWWPESLSEWEQYGSLFFVASNSSITGFNAMETMFANSELITERGLTDPIDLVLEGTWTIDEMIKIIKAFEDDVDGDDKIYGLGIDDDSRVDSFYYGSGFSSTLNNADGVAETAWFSTTVIDRVTTLLNKLVPVFNGNAVFINESDNISLMQDDKAALFVASLDRVTKLEDTDYAPLPMPKYDLDQTNYRTIQNNAYDVWCVPSGASDPELSAMVIEAIASSDYRTLAPYYFDKYMKLRYASDDICSQMFETVRQSVALDFGRVSHLYVVGVESAWRACFWDYDNNVQYAQNNFATTVADLRPSAEVKLAELLKAYRRFQNQQAS